MICAVYINALPFHFQSRFLFCQRAGIQSSPVPLVLYCSVPPYRGCLCRMLSSTSILLYPSPGLLGDYKQENEINQLCLVLQGNIEMYRYPACCNHDFEFNFSRKICVKLVFVVGSFLKRFISNLYSNS